MELFYFQISSYDASLKIKDYVENHNYSNVVIIAYTANQGEEEIAKCKNHRRIFAFFIDF